MRDFRPSLFILLLLGLAQSCVSDETTLKSILKTLPSFMIQMGQVTKPPGGDVSASDFCLAVAIDPQDEGIYCAGQTRSDFAEPNASSGALPDALIVKFDRNKNLLWARQFGATTFPLELGTRDTFTGIAIDSQGFIYASGSNNGSAMVAKFHRKGALQWRRIIPASSRCINIAIHKDRIFCSGKNTVNGNAQAFEIDSSGNVLWLKETLGGSETPSGIAVDGIGNLYIAGITESSLVVGHTPAAGKLDVFVWKLRPDGTEAWIDQIGTDDYDEIVYSIAIDRTGAIVLGGYFVGTGNPLPPDLDFDPGFFTTAQENTFVGKYLDTGSGLSQVWLERTRFASKSTILTLLVAPNNDIVCGGRIAGSLYETMADGTFDAYVLRLSPEGTTLHSRQFASISRGKLDNTGYQDCSALAMDPLGNIICGGHTEGNTDEIGGGAGNDIMIYRVGPNLEF